MHSHSACRSTPVRPSWGSAFANKVTAGQNWLWHFSDPVILTSDLSTPKHNYTVHYPFERIHPEQEHTTRKRERERERERERNRLAMGGLWMVNEATQEEESGELDNRGKIWKEKDKNRKTKGQIEQKERGKDSQ